MDTVGKQVMRNQRNEPLLVAGNANNDAENPQVVLKFPPGVSSVSLRYRSCHFTSASPVETDVVIRLSLYLHQGQVH